MQNHCDSSDLEFPIVLWGDMQKQFAIPTNKEPQDPLSVQWKVKCVLLVHVWSHGWMPHRRYPWSWTSNRCQRSAADCNDYERVSTFCNRKCDHGGHPATDKQKKCFGGWNVMWTVGFNHWTPQGCYWLPSMLLKAKGSFRLGFAVIRPDGVSDRNFQGPHERLWICESKSKQLTAGRSCSSELLENI